MPIQKEDEAILLEKEVMGVTEYKIKRTTEKQMEKEKTLEQIEFDYNFIKIIKIFLDIIIFRGECYVRNRRFIKGYRKIKDTDGRPD